MQTKIIKNMDSDANDYIIAFLEDILMQKKTKNA